MNEMILVNEDNEIIGYKDRKDIQLKDIYRVSALWIVNSKGEILLAKRVMSKKKDPGKWGPGVAGTVEKGETYEQNIVKEAEEELGIKELVLRKSKIIRVKDGYNYFLKIFFVTLNKSLESFKLREEEVEEIRWFSLNEIKEKLNSNRNYFVKGLDSFIENLS